MILARHEMAISSTIVEIVSYVARRQFSWAAIEIRMNFRKKSYIARARSPTASGKEHGAWRRA